MRSLADLHCLGCNREYYADLPNGHGLHYGMLLERGRSLVHGHSAAPWFASWLKEDYTTGRTNEVGFDVDGSVTDRAVLLNCLDRVYGHALLKLLNAQHHLDADDGRDLIVVVPSILSWCVPDDVDEVWTVDWSLRTPYWGDELAEALRKRVSSLEGCVLSPAFPLPPSDSYDIERFTRVDPFPVEQWDERPPTVTVVWRPDRAWAASTDVNRSLARLRAYLRVGLDRIGINATRWEQHRNITALGNALRTALPEVDVAVAGLGEPGGLPTWITDDRVADPDDEAERRLCGRYARSHVVVGVHGSNMLLPSAHAGGAVDLVPRTKWGNLTEDLSVRDVGARDSLFQYRHLPRNTLPGQVATVVESMLTDRSERGWHKSSSATAPTWEDACGK